MSSRFGGYGVIIELLPPSRPSVIRLNQSFGSREILDRLSPVSLCARAKPIEVLIKCLCIRCFPSTCRIRLVLLMSLHLSLSLCLVGFISSDGERVALIEIPPRQMFQLEIDDEDLDSFFLGAFSSIDADLLSSRLVR